MTPPRQQFQQLFLPEEIAFDETALFEPPYPPRRAASLTPPPREGPHGARAFIGPSACVHGAPAPVVGDPHSTLELRTNRMPPMGWAEGARYGRCSSSCPADRRLGVLRRARPGRPNHVRLHRYPVLRWVGDRLVRAGCGPAITDFSLTTPAGVFDSSNADGFIFEHSPAVSPNADFVRLFFGDSAGLNFVNLLFQTTLQAFDGSTFYPGVIKIFGGATGSEVDCARPEFPGSACTALLVSGFSDGFAIPREDPATVPEPATMTLLGLGLAGMGARRWRQRKTS
jgi:hypothetical protein